MPDDIPPPYRIHIRRRKAYPACCPVCGASSELPPSEDTFGLLKAIYQSFNHVYPQRVPGWKGHWTWFYECVHHNPMAAAMNRANPFFEMVRSLKAVDEFQGGTFTIPIPLTNNR